MDLESLHCSRQTLAPLHPLLPPLSCTITSLGRGKLGRWKLEHANSDTRLPRIPEGWVGGGGVEKKVDRNYLFHLRLPWIPQAAFFSSFLSWRHGGCIAGISNSMLSWRFLCATWPQSGFFSWCFKNCTAYKCMVRWRKTKDKKTKKTNHNASTHRRHIKTDEYDSKKREAIWRIMWESRWERLHLTGYVRMPVNRNEYASKCFHMCT